MHTDSTSWHLWLQNRVPTNPSCAAWHALLCTYDNVVFLCIWYPPVLNTGVKYVRTDCISMVHAYVNIRTKWWYLPFRYPRILSVMISRQPIWEVPFFLRSVEYMRKKIFPFNLVLPHVSHIEYIIPHRVYFLDSPFLVLLVLIRAWLIRIPCILLATLTRGLSIFLLI